MAVNPQDLAEEQTQRAEINAAGAPTEFATDPAQGVQVAALGKIAKLTSKLPNPVKMDDVPVNPDAAQKNITDVPVGRPPTGSETPLAEASSPLYSYKRVQRQVAPDVLEDPESLAEFKKRGYQAFPVPDEKLLEEAKQFATEKAANAEKIAESVNAKAKSVITKQQKNAGVRPDNLLDGDRTKSVLERLESMKADIKGIKNGGDFNTARMLTGEDVHQAIEVLSEDFADEIDLVKRGVITQNETITDAAKILAEDELGFTKELLSRKIGDGSFNAAKTLAARQLLVLNMERALNIFKKIQADMANEVEPAAQDLFEFRRLLTLQAGIQLQTKGNQTEAARTLNIFNVDVGGEDSAAFLAKNAERILQESGGKETALELVERFGLLAESEDPIGGINRFALKAYYAKTKEVIHQAYMTGLLSNPATQLKNILGTGSYMLYQIPSEFLAGAFGAAYRKQAVIRGITVDPDQVYMRDAALRMKGWYDSFGDALSAGALAFRTESPSGGKNRYDLEIYNPVGQAEEGFFAKSLSYAGKGVRLPFRLLLGADEFFKVMSSRGELYTAVSRRYGDLIMQGKTDEEALAEAGMLLLDPKAVDEVVEERALYDTMQSDLGKLGKLTGAIQNNFLGRFVLPFATAPTNSMFRVLENSPLGFYKTVAPEFVGGGKSARERQLAAGRAFMSSAVMYYFSQQAVEGRITGSRPRNKAAREALPPGWQPYSFVVRGEGFPEDMPLFDQYGRPNGPLNYISYGGFEPIGAILGLSADYAQKASELPPGDNYKKILIDHAAIISGAAADYMSELPMLKGIADIADTMRGEGLENLLRSYPQNAAYPGFVPNPLSGLQRGLYDLGVFGGDPNVVKPRKDVEYYTKEERYRKDKDGKYVYGTTPTGEPQDVDLIGTVKDSGLEKLLSSVYSYSKMDSAFANQYDTNAILYDTLGQPIQSTSLSIANNPIAAIRNRILGIRIEPGVEPSASEAELIMLYGETGKWPLSNKEDLAGIPLTFGAQSDWTRIAKNEKRMPVPMLGNSFLSFQEALTMLTTGKVKTDEGANLTDFSSNYKAVSNAGKIDRIRKLQAMFYDASIQDLFQETDSEGNLRFENLKQAYEDVQMQRLKEEQRRKRENR